MQNSCSDSPGLRQLGIQPIRNKTHRTTGSNSRESDKTNPWDERLKELKLPTLSYRRLHGDMIEAFKVINGIYDRNTSQFVKLWKGMIQRTGLRGNPNKIFTQRATCNIRKYSFAPRIATLWQSLPKETTNAPSINSSKKRLDNCGATMKLLIIIGRKSRERHHMKIPKLRVRHRRLLNPALEII